MKLNCALFLCFLALLAAIPARATVLPDACGSDKIKFDVSQQKSPSALPAPASGKAQIVLVEDNNRMVTPFSYATVRFGLDGTWVGADKGDSYFVVNVDPGVHHVCANWQSGLSILKRDVNVTSFTAEAGKTYYFAAQITVVSKEDISFALVPLNDDEGKYRVKAWKLSAAKPK